MVKRPTYASIDLDGLEENLREVERRVPEGTRIMAVVKANGYGHGDIDISSRLESCGCNLFGVAIAEEGVRLREGGIKGGIVVLGGIYPGQEAAVIEWGLTPVIFDIETARRVNEEALGRGVTVEVHLKVDSGMGRLGILPGEVDGFLKDLKGLVALKITGLLSHFAEAGNEDRRFTVKQLEVFSEVAERVKAAGFKGIELHIANSAAILNGNYGGDEEGSGALDATLNIVRPGIMLYGASPEERFKGMVKLKPVMTIKTEILLIKNLPEGSPISYDRRFTTLRESRIATIPIGYGDGLPRSLSGKGRVLISGEYAPIVGTVCMDLTMVDVTGIESAAVGDEVVVIGSQGRRGISVEEVASLSGTIPYEIFCNISDRVPRVVTGNK